MIGWILFFWGWGGSFFGGMEGDAYGVYLLGGWREAF